MSEDIETIFDEVLEDMELDDDQTDLAMTIRARVLRRIRDMED
jgi:hypothetical protein